MEKRVVGVDVAWMGSQRLVGVEVVVVWVGLVGQHGVYIVCGCVAVVPFPYYYYATYLSTTYPPTYYYSNSYSTYPSTYLLSTYLLPTPSIGTAPHYQS